MAASIGGSRLERMSIEFPVREIKEKVQIIETTISNKGKKIWSFRKKATYLNLDYQDLLMSSDKVLILPKIFCVAQH